MIKKSRSQKIARVFEIVNYFMAPVPVAFGGLLLFFAPWMLFFVWLLWTLCGPGLWLAAQYFKHSRGGIDGEKIPPIWIATIVFNGLLLLLNICYVYPNYNSPGESHYPEIIRTVEVVWTVLVIWWISAIFLSLIALGSEKGHRKGLSD